MNLTLPNSFNLILNPYLDEISKLGCMKPVVHVEPVVLVLLVTIAATSGLALPVDDANDCVGDKLADPDIVEQLIDPTDDGCGGYW